MGLIRRAFKRGDVRVSRWIAETEQPTLDEVLYIGPASDSLLWDEAQQIVRLPNEAEMLAAAKAARIAANRGECTSRIYARYPAGRQSSVALGIYSGAEAEAQAQIMKDWISDMVAAENAAADLIEAATTVAAVEAVTVAWPA